MEVMMLPKRFQPFERRLIAVHRIMRHRIGKIPKDQSRKKEIIIIPHDKIENAK